MIIINKLCYLDERTNRTKHYYSLNTYSHVICLKMFFGNDYVYVIERNIPGCLYRYFLSDEKYKKSYFGYLNK